MWVWILVALAVLAVVVWAFWPRRRGVVDGDLRRRQQIDQAAVEQYRRADVPNYFGGG